MKSREHKNIVATLYLKDGKAVFSPDHLEQNADALDIARLYNDCGIDKIICFDLSKDEDEREKNILAIRSINREIDTKICGGGNIERIEDVKRFLFAGCVEVVLNGSKPGMTSLMVEVAEKYGKEKVLVSLKNVDFIFKSKDVLSDNIHELLIMNRSLYSSLENVTEVPYILIQDEYNFEEILEELRSEQIRGIYGEFINDPSTDIMQLKGDLSDQGIKMDNFAPALHWGDLKVDKSGLIPVVTQDYRTHEVLMVAYMNEEAFDKTIRIGKMTYFSRSRNELWTKGLTSGNIQYVKSLTADCDYDTILAKVSQIGAACHTGAKSCFFNSIIQKEYREKNPVHVLDSEYNEILRSIKSDDGSETYAGQLFKKGLDSVLKKVGEESAEVLIAAKNPGKEELRKEIADYLYDLMILMAEKELTWEDVTRELSQR